MVNDQDNRPAWAERCLTRADELKALAAWCLCDPDPSSCESARRQALSDEIHKHLACARRAAERTDRRVRRTGARIDTAMSRLDAAEAELMQLAPAEYITGQMSSVVNHVGRHLQPTDPRRVGVERIAAQLAALSGSDAVRNSRANTHGANAGGRHGEDEARRAQIAAVVDESRVTIASAIRGASSAAVREQTRVRSFRNVVVASTLGMLVVACGLIVLGALSPTTVPLCFAPEELDEVTVVCPTGQSGPITPSSEAASVSATEIDDTISRTVSPIDVAVVAIIGTTAAAVAAAAAIRRIRGSSEPYGVPIALALLKLPTGAVTAVLGLLLMRGGFVPGLSALDTSAQILAWAAVFGYAQQLFTRLVDQQGDAVLDRVRGADKGTEAPRSS